MKKYPEIEKANSMLRRLAMMGFCDKYEGEEHVSLAMQQLVEELIAVERQGSASGYYLLYTALNAIDAKSEDFLFCGHMENSIIMYSLGFLDVNPVDVSQENPLYNEFILWGSDRDPAFELKVSAELMNRLVEYFKDHNADGLLKAKYIEVDKQLWVSMDQGETVSRDSFSMLFMTMEKEQCLQIRTDYNDICEKCCPETYKDKIRCFGLAIGTGAWENNAKQLLSSGQVSFDEVITCREDVYEFLIKHGIKRQEAYSIAEDVRKGKIHVNGWAQNDLDMLKAANVAEWFIESCRMIKNLGTRIHEMIYYKRYIESIAIEEHDDSETEEDNLQKQNIESCKLALLYILSKMSYPLKSSDLYLGFPYEDIGFWIYIDALCKLEEEGLICSLSFERMEHFFITRVGTDVLEHRKKEIGVSELQKLDEYIKDLEDKERLLRGEEEFFNVRIKHA